MQVSEDSHLTPMQKYEAYERQVDHRDYERWVNQMTTHVEQLAGQHRNVFEADLRYTDDLFSIYLNNMPYATRHLHDCNTCRRFFQRFGALVVVNDAGVVESALWTPQIVPPYYAAAVAAVRQVVEAAPIKRVFTCSASWWGTLRTPPWSHFAIRPPAAWRHDNAGRWMANKRENFVMVERALNRYPRGLIARAAALLRTDDFHRGKEFLPRVEWLLALKDTEYSYSPPVRWRFRNLLWREVAAAPDGFCHIASSMVGTLLQGLEEHQPTEALIRGWNAATHPLQYQRPQAAPSAGNIQQAERIFAEKGLTQSVERRFAAPSDIPLLWSGGDQPQHTQCGDHRLFSNVQPKGSWVEEAYGQSVTTMTWVKFAREMLPNISHIEAELPPVGSYAVFTHALHQHAPSLFKWGTHLSYYLWNGGSTPQSMSLTGDTAEVWGIAAMPCDQRPGDITGLTFLLKGARETRMNAGLALFPEHLRSDLREVRATIEAFSHQGRMVDTGDPHAIGLMHRVSLPKWDILLRVKHRGYWERVRIDRYD